MLAIWLRTIDSAMSLRLALAWAMPASESPSRYRYALAGPSPSRKTDHTHIPCTSSPCISDVTCCARNITFCIPAGIVTTTSLRPAKYRRPTPARTSFPPRNTSMYSLGRACLMRERSTAVTTPSKPGTSTRRSSMFSVPHMVPLCVCMQHGVVKGRSRPVWGDSGVIAPLVGFSSKVLRRQGAETA